MIEFKESKFYKLLQDFFINNNKETFLQMLSEFYNRTEGIINKNDTQDDLIKELREMYLKFNEEGIDENIVREKVNYFLENSNRIMDIISEIDNIIYLKESDVGYKNSEKIQNKLKLNTNINIKSKNNDNYIIKNTIEIDNNNSITLDNNTVLKNASLSNMIRKKENIDRLQNIKLSGGIYNYDNQTAGGNNLHTIFIHKCDDLLIEKLQVLNSSKYAFLLADINRGTIKDITLNTSSDGIHFQPPLKNILVENIKGTSHDDMIAITIGDFDAYNTSAGDVEDIVIRNIQPNNSLTALKLCGQNGYKFKNVLMEQVYGNTRHEGFYLRSDGPILNDFTAEKIVLRDINVKTGGDNYPLVKLWVDTQMNIDTLILENIKHDGYLFDIRGAGNWSIKIKNLHLKNIDLSMSSNENILKYFGFIGVNVTIENLYIDNVNIDSNKISSSKYECFIENRGKIKNLYVDKTIVKYPINKYAFIRNIDGIINNLNLDNYYQYQGACVYYQNSKTYTGYIRINNVNLDEVWEAFNVNADTIFTLASTTTSRNGATFKTNNSDGTYKITGELINTTNINVSCVAGSSVGNIYVDGNINVDIEKVKGIATGARCYNTNNNVWTGKEYYVYNNWGWEKEVNKNVVRYVTSDYRIDKYDSFIKTNGTITITLPDSSPIIGKLYSIINISTNNTVTINDSSGVRVETLPPNTRKDIISGGSNWHIF